MCFYLAKAPRPGGFSLNAQHNRLNMPIAMHSACSKHWIKVVSKKCAALLLNQVEGRLKSLKIQHRIFSKLTTIQLSFSKEYSHAPKILSRISNRRRVAYLVLVTLISHGKRCGTDFSDSKLRLHRDQSISLALVCEKEISHPRCWNFNQRRGLSSPWLNSDPEGEISQSYMNRLMMDCFSPTFRRFLLEYKS